MTSGETNVTAFRISPDGRRIVFAMRGPLDDIDEEEDPPTWNIWEYNVETQALRRIIHAMRWLPESPS